MKRVATLLLPVVLVGCATHDSNQVRIEDRSIQNQGSLQSPGVSPAPAPLPERSAQSYPTQPQAVPATPSQLPQTQSAPAETPSYQPPAVVAAPSQPSGALLALLEQAEQQHQSGRNQQALSSLERAQRIAPRDPLVYLQLARLRLDMKDYGRAQQLANKGLSLSSGNPQMQKAFKALMKQISNR